MNAHSRARTRLIELRAGHGRPPHRRPIKIQLCSPRDTPTSPHRVSRGPTSRVKLACQCQPEPTLKHARQHAPCSRHVAESKDACRSTPIARRPLHRAHTEQHIVDVGAQVPADHVALGAGGGRNMARRLQAIVAPRQLRAESEDAVAIDAVQLSIERLARLAHQVHVATEERAPSLIG